jgi:hypothetical protein
MAWWSWLASKAKDVATVVAPVLKAAVTVGYGAVLLVNYAYDLLVNGVPDLPTPTRVPAPHKAGMTIKDKC